MGLFIWLEHTRFAIWLHESESVFAFPMVLLLHTIGMGLLVGLATVVNLRLLGCIPRVRLAPMLKLFPLMWLGFWINAVTGVLLLIADATNKLANPVFYIKLVLVALGVLSIIAIRSHVFRDPALDKAPISSNGKALAVASLVLWATAITAGRLMAYLGPRHAAWMFEILGRHS